MSQNGSSKPQVKDYGQTWEIAAALWDGPRTLPEIVDHFYGYIRLLGLHRVTKRIERCHERMAGRVEDALEVHIDQGWVVRRGERYALTPRGREAARKPIDDMRRARGLLSKLAQPETVSQVGLAVHLGLAALKLPAALLSGSMGLLNDGADTLLDGLSSVLVYLGLRFDRERVANVALVLVMLGTGGFTLYEAVRRVFSPFEPRVDAFTFVATIVSAVVCWALYLYQRVVGVRSGSVALITQLVDSRNHVIVAASVGTGLVASLVGFPLLDTLVGLVVAALVFKSGVELAVETIRSLGQEDVDLSRYQIEIAGWYEQFRRAQLRDWMLYLVDVEKVATRRQLVTRTTEALDFGDHPMLRALGVERAPEAQGMIERSVRELFDRGWLIEDGRLTLSDAGKEWLDSRTRKEKRAHGWL